MEKSSKLQDICNKAYEEGRQEGYTFGFQEGMAEGIAYTKEGIVMAMLLEPELSDEKIIQLAGITGEKLEECKMSFEDYPYYHET